MSASITPLTATELERLEGQWRGEWRNEVTSFAVRDIWRLLAEVRRLRAELTRQAQMYGGVYVHDADWQPEDLSAPIGRDPERLGLGASTPDIPESGSLGPSEGSTGKPGSGSAPKAPLSNLPLEFERVESYPPPLTAPPPQWLPVDPVTGRVDWHAGLSFQGRFFKTKNGSLNDWLTDHGLRPIPVTSFGARIGDAEYAYLAAHLQVRHENEIAELLERFQPTEF